MIRVFYKDLAQDHVDLDQCEKIIHHLAKTNAEVVLVRLHLYEYQTTSDKGAVNPIQPTLRKANR